MSHETPITAVLDTNVLFPPTLRDTLLYAADDGLFDLVWSEEILEELRRNLVEQAGFTEEAAARRVKWMADAFPTAAVAGDLEAAPALPDPKDRHVLALAVAAQADVIVTQNLRDFPAAVVSPLGVGAVSADAFLVRLLRESPEVMMASLRHHASLLRHPPMSMVELLGALEKHAPTLVREAMDRLDWRSTSG